MVEIEVEHVDNTLNKTDVITSVSPIWGLMGTVIPRNLCLADLCAGDINTSA